MKAKIMVTEFAATDLGGARSSNNKSEGVKPAVFLQLQNKTLTKK